MSELVKNEKVTVKSLLSSEDMTNRLKEILGKRASTFATSVLQITSNNKMLSECEPVSIVGAAMISATLDLPLNNNLGYAYIVPYNEKQSNGNWSKKAQFQIGYKGFIQLAMRSGQFKTINVTDIKEGEIKERDRLTGQMEYNWIDNDLEREKAETIGYVAYFKLINGYEATFYMSKKELITHGKKFSQTFKKGFGLWKDDFNSMSKKTVLKLLLSKFAPLSIEMQKAVITDQGYVNDLESTEVSYPDNSIISIDAEEVDEQHEEKRVLEHIKKSKDLDTLLQVEDNLNEVSKVAFTDKLKALQK